MLCIAPSEFLKRFFLVSFYLTLLHNPLSVCLYFFFFQNLFFFFFFSGKMCLWRKLKKNFLFHFESNFSVAMQDIKIACFQIKTIKEERQILYLRKQHKCKTSLSCSTGFIVRKLNKKFRLLG